MEDNDCMHVEDYEPVFVARQPIFDRKLRVWGYELLFRHSRAADMARIENEDQATAKVIADGFVLAAAGLPPDKKLLINFPKNLLLDGSIYALPSQMCVVEILETVEPDIETVAALKAAKKAGYALALDDFVGQPGFEVFLRLADIVKVDVLHMPHDALAAVTAALRKGQAALLAEKVEDRESYERLRDMGYQLFQGYFFSKPELMPGRKISSSSAIRLELLHKLAEKDYEVKELTYIISKDVSLSYRLLGYLNSPAFGLRRTIDSLQQAITILGLRNTRQWLMVIMLADMNPSPRNAEIGLQCIQRARFFQTMAEAGEKTPFTSQGMFLLGLLSRLDALLGLPLEEVLEKMPLDPKVKNALLHPENAGHAWIELVEALENARWRRTDTLLNAFGVGKEQSAMLYAQAGVWANNILSSSTGH